MLKSAHIQNFRSLRDVRLELEPLTILVGPNATGKSAVLDALNPLVYDHQIETWQRDTKLRITRRFEEKKGRIFTWDGSHKKTGDKYADVEYQKLQLDLSCLRESNTAAEAIMLEADGSNLTNVFSTLTRDEQIAIRDEFCQLVPVYSDINVRPVSSGKLQLVFHDQWAKAVKYKPHQVSDGTMLMLAYLTLQYQEKSPDIVAIEEPERGLHPYLLERLVKFFRDLATGTRGRGPFNIVLATHSAELLEYARPEEVRFLDRSPKTGETTIDSPPVDEDGWEETMDIYLNSLGNAWLAGGLGGVPGS